MFAKLFPHLFPFGHGHPGTDRRVSVSLQQCKKHYLSISSRRFAQDDTFPLIAFDIVSRKRAMGQINPVRTSQCKNCSSVFGGDEVLRYSVNEMKKTISMSYKVSILADDSTSGTGTENHNNCSAIEDDEYVALRAAIPVIPDMPPSDCSDHVNLSHKLHTTQLFLLNQKHNWRHVPSCFKTSGHVKGETVATIFRGYIRKTQK